MEIEPIDLNDENNIAMDLFDEEDDQPGNPDEEAIEVPAPGGEGEAKIIKPKRVIKNPQPKLDAIRLMGPRGIGILQNTFKEVKFKGKGYEKEDLKMLMKKLEHWAHRLYPKLPFDDTLKQIEKLGTKKPVQNMMTRIRLDMYQSDEMIEGNSEENGNTDSNETSNIDVFDELLANKDARSNDIFDELLTTGPFSEQNSQVHRATPLAGSQSTTTTATTTTATTPNSLTDEQRAKMERNRLMALERRKAKLLEQQKIDDQNKSLHTLDSSSSLSNFINDSSISTVLPLAENNDKIDESLNVNKDRCLTMSDEDRDITNTPLKYELQSNLTDDMVSTEKMETDKPEDEQIIPKVSSMECNLESTDKENKENREAIVNSVDVYDEEEMVTVDDVLSLINVDESNSTNDL